ncbi:MAG: magnesium transporter [Defluviitaleaceae bacterium]|nr:magnesium transporter [Defluviitaleaceae bacterium]
MQELILTHINNKDMEALKAMLATAEEIEILHAFHDLTPEEQLKVFRLLSKDHALRIFEELDTDEQQNLLRSFTDEKAVEFVNELAPDDRVRLLDELPASVAKKLLNSISSAEREATNVLMGYAPKTAGRIMTPEFIRLSRDMTASEALEKVRKRAQEMETVYLLYITDSAKKLEGAISLKELVCSSGDTKVEELMSKKAISVTTDTDQEEVARILQDLDLLAIPVVDKEGRVVGIVTIDDAIDILEEETTEDIFDAAGFADVAGKESDRSEVLTKGRIWKIWAVRLPFLVITLAAGMAAGLIIEGFEAILESVVIVAFFIPLIMDMGGNVGTQSSTVFARGVVLGHIDIKRFLRPFLKELLVGVSMGSMVGVVAGVIISFWIGIPVLGLAVGISLIATMTLAAVLGFIVPFLLIKFKVDQAAGASPIITSIKDISGLFIYFGLITLLMGAYLQPTYEITGKYVTTEGFYFYVDMAEEEATVIGRVEGYEGAEVPEYITVGDETFPVVDVSVLSASKTAAVKTSDQRHSRISPITCVAS